eukprot:SAG22_NODE_5133_length_1080_cov_0.898063_1_plen_354_part_10
MYHVGHANAWLQAKLCTGEPGQDVRITVAIHEGESVRNAKGRPTVFNDAERQLMAESCKWVDRAITGVPYDLITEKVIDDADCAWVSHGDDMIILPGKPHMYTEAAAAGRFKMFPRTPGISTTAQRARIKAALVFESSHDNTAVEELRADFDANRSTFSPTAGLTESFFRFEPEGRQRGGSEPLKTVYLHGVFDLYNPGDVQLLDAAAALGDRLVVGLVDDAAAATVSGNPFLPIVPLQERALVVLSHRAVSDVIVGSPLELDAQFLADHNVDVVAVDPRGGGRYALPPAALAAAEAAGVVKVPTLEPVLGGGDGAGKHLTADSVLDRLLAAQHEEEGVNTSVPPPPPAAAVQQ